MTTDRLLLLSRDGTKSKLLFMRYEHLAAMMIAGGGADAIGC
jgi:hypothetical protein